MDSIRSVRLYFKDVVRVNNLREHISFSGLAKWIVSSTSINKYNIETHLLKYNAVDVNVKIYFRFIKC